jgi:hypothetical protein
MGERFSDVNVVNRVPHGSGGVMVWADISYGQQNCILSTAILMHRDTVARSWGPLSCHSSATITSCFSMIMHDPMSQASVHNSWELKMAQFFHDLHTHQTCHPLGMFGMLWIDMYDSMFQFPPKSISFAQPLKGNWTTFHRPQSRAWSTLCEGDVLRFMRQIVFTPDAEWFSDPRPYLF